MWRRKLDLKATFESGSSHFRFERPDPGGFNVGCIGSARTALPLACSAASTAGITSSMYCTAVPSGPDPKDARFTCQGTQHIVYRYTH